MLDLLGKGTDRGYSMIGVGLSAGLSGSRRARTVQDPLPALDLDWATNRSLPASYGPTPTFTRASSGTYFDGQGILKTAAVNGPRFNHVYNGTSWVSRGLLVEEQRTNICTYSEDLTNAAWSKVQLSISANAVSAPDGNTTADKLVENTANATHYTRQTFSGISSGATVTFSAFFKAAERGTVALIGSDNVAKNYPVLFDLVNGTVLGNLTSWGAYAAPLSSSITNVGNGWYRCVVVVQLDAGVTTASITPMLSNSSSTSFTGSYAGDGSSGVYQWGAMVEVGSFPTSYIPTTSASTTRSADVCQITGSDFSGFWNGTEGSFAVEYDLPSDHLADRGLLTANDGTAAKYITIYGQSGSGQPGKNAFFVVNPSLQAGIYSATVAANTTTKIASAWKLNDFASYSQGTAGTPDGTGTIPSPLTQLEIGKGYPAGTGDPIQIGHIARLRYYPTRLTNAKLQELST